MKPISWTQYMVVLLRPGTKRRNMKECEAAHCPDEKSKSSSADLHKLGILPPCSESSPYLSKASSSLLSHLNCFPIWTSVRSITVCQANTKKIWSWCFNKSSASTVSSALQAPVPFCLFKSNFPGNVKDNINNDHELGWMNRFAEVQCSLNIWAFNQTKWRLGSEGCGTVDRQK